MKFKDFVENAQQYLKDNPETADLEVVYASDDEGNSFRTLYHDPGKGRYDDREFIPFDQFEDWEIDEEDYPVNAVCIN